MQLEALMSRAARQWLIVACGLLLAVGAGAEPKLPPLPRSMLASQTEEVAELRIGEVYFDSARHELTSEDRARLEAIGRRLAGLPVYILIEAHTDGDGEAASNLALSERRGSACGAALSAPGGIAADQLVVIGYGAAYARAASSAAKAMERRVIMRVLRRLDQAEQRHELLATLRARGVEIVASGVDGTAAGASSAAVPELAHQASAGDASPRAFGLGFVSGGIAGKDAGRGSGLGLSAAFGRLGARGGYSFEAWSSNYTTRDGSVRVLVRHAGLGLAMTLAHWRRLSAMATGGIGLALVDRRVRQTAEALPQAAAGATYDETSHKLPTTYVDLIALARYPKGRLGLGLGPGLRLDARGGAFGVKLGVFFLPSAHGAD